MGYLIDSNILIDYVADCFSAPQLIRLDKIFDREFIVSIITRIETLGFNAGDREEKELLQFFSIANVIALTSDIAELTIVLRKTRKMTTPDAIIAASAINLRYMLLTRNIADFKIIPALSVINPHDW